MLSIDHRTIPEYSLFYHIFQLALMALVKPNLNYNYYYYYFYAYSNNIGSIMDGNGQSMVF